MPTNNMGRAIIPFTIVNHSGVDPKVPIYLYMFGTLDPKYPRLNSVYLSNLNGDCTRFFPGKKGLSYGLRLTFENNEAKTFLPQLDGIRIYISFDMPLEADVNDDGYPDAVSAENPGPNFYRVWDFIEGTWANYGDHTVLHVNTTQVDAFGLAFKLEHTGLNPADRSQKLTIVNGFDDSADARHKIFSDLLAAGDPWRKLVVAAGCRVLMPLKSMDKNVFPRNQLDAYIKQVGEFYRQGAQLIFNNSGVNYTGVTTVAGSSFAFVFTPDKAKDSAGRPTFTFRIPAPTTRICYTQDMKPTPNDALGVGRAICAALGASFLRATLIYYPKDGFPVPQLKRDLYYAKAPVCEYARIIHKYGIRNHAFCYGYDEVAGDAGENRDVWNPTSMKLTIQPINWDAAYMTMREKAETVDAG